MYQTLKSDPDSEFQRQTQDDIFLKELFTVNSRSQTLQLEKFVFCLYSRLISKSKWTRKRSILCANFVFQVMTPKTMSEAFEEIKFDDQSDLNDSNETTTISQTSSDLANDNRRSDRSATIMTDQVQTVLPKDLEFELTWETRDAIHSTLSRHSKLLSGLITTADFREKMQQTNADLISALMNLPPKSDSPSRCFESISSDKGLNEVILDINWDVCSRVVDLLMINNTALLDDESMTGECKLKLIDQNADLTYELLKLKSRTVSVDASKGTILDLENSQVDESNLQVYD